MCLLRSFDQKQKYFVIIAELIPCTFLSIAVHGDDPPALPRGLLDSTTPHIEATSVNYTPAFNLGLSGFLDIRAGILTQSNTLEKQTSLLETRLQLHIEGGGNQMGFQLTSDFLYDDIAALQDIDLKQGEGPIDLREANFFYRPTDWMDIKAGRQILTWGTGDLLFINDLFPKDFESLLIGRDENYLKTPSDAIKLSLFSDLANLDIVYTPLFDTDRFPDGNRVSLFNPTLGRVTGQNNTVKVTRPDNWFDDDEVALRLYKNIQAYELAGYLYHGFWKSPAGQNPMTGSASFPPLSVYGLSLRGPAGLGIGSFEFGYYDSRDDPKSNDPLIRNSELRTLLAYEQEVAHNFTTGIQYMLEHNLHYDSLQDSVPAGNAPPDEYRHVMTLRLTQLLLNQNLILSLFSFYSPSDEDAYLLPKISYKVTDSLLVQAGSNQFFGTRDDTFFGQFKNNTNIYVSLRYSFAKDILK